MKFKFSIGGYFGGYFEFVLKKGHLYCYIPNYPLKSSEPTHIFSIHDDPDWETLLHFLKTLKWKPTYDVGICDGTQWTLEVKYEDINIKSYGSNVYPRGFYKFLRLLNNVTKKHGIAPAF